MRGRVFHVLTLVLSSFFFFIIVDFYLARPSSLTSLKITWQHTIASILTYVYLYTAYTRIPITTDGSLLFGRDLIIYLWMTAVAPCILHVRESHNIHVWCNNNNIHNTGIGMKKNIYTRIIIKKLPVRSLLGRLWSPLVL